MPSILSEFPTSLSTLQIRLHRLENKTIGEIAQQIHMDLPKQLTTHKGLVGQLIEHLLGAEAGNQSQPDFISLGIELKTIPVNAAGRPQESTYVCTVPLNPLAYPTFETSVVYAKLAHVLWVPLLTQGKCVHDWRILKAVFWKPNATELHTLQTDFNELMDIITLGGLEEVTARMGEALHIRPKAADGKQLTTFVGREGIEEKTLPRGFYLRPAFTQNILKCLQA